MITLIKTIAQGTYKSTLISLKNSKNLVLLKEKMRFFFFITGKTHTHADILWQANLFIQFTVYRFLHLSSTFSHNIYLFKMKHPE